MPVLDLEERRARRQAQEGPFGTTAVPPPSTPAPNYDAGTGATTIGVTKPPPQHTTPVQGPIFSGGPGPSASAPTLQDAERILRGLASQYGATMEANDPQLLLEKARGIDAYGGDLQKAAQEFAAQYQRRGASTSHRPYDSQTTNPAQQAAIRQADVAAGRGVMDSAALAAMGAGGSGSTGPFVSSYDDPAYALAEEFALKRLQDRMQPPAGSGTAAFEDYARQFADALQEGPFSDQEEAALRVSAFDQLNRRRQAEKDRKAEELAARGIVPKSGVWDWHMKAIDDKWDSHIAQNENQLQLYTINERQRRATQALNVYGALAGSEDARMREAFQLSQVPVLLQNQSFNNLLRAVIAGGDAGSIFSGALSLANLLESQRQFDAVGQENLWGNIGLLMAGIDWSEVF